MNLRCILEQLNASRPHWASQVFRIWSISSTSLPQRAYRRVSCLIQDFTGLTSGEFLGFWGSARGTVGLPVSTATGLRMHGKSDGAVVVRCRAHAGRQEIRRSCKNSNSCASTYFVSRCAVNRTLRRSSSQTPSPNQRPTGSKTTSDTYGHCTHTASLQMAGTH